MGPSRAEVGFGSRLVGCVRHFCPPPRLLWLVFGPSSARFFFSLALSGFARFGLGVLVLVFSFFPFLFCVPPLVFRLSNCHLIFIVISFPFSFHLHLMCRSLKKPRGSGRVCVCVCMCADHLHRCKTSFWLVDGSGLFFLDFELCLQGDGVCFRCLHPTKTHLLHSDMDWGRSIHVPAQSFSFSSMATG